MDLHFTVSPQEVDLLQVSITDGGLVISGFVSGRKIVFNGEFGNVNVNILQNQNPICENARGSGKDSVVEATRGRLKTSVVKHSEHPLFRQLIALRRQIASDEKVPAFVVFNDNTLAEICECMPADLQSFEAIRGIGPVKLQKYGEKFVGFIREYVNQAKEVS